MIRETDEQYFARLLMIKKIHAMADEVGSYPISKVVLDVMARVPRHRFVPAEQMYSAYENYPLPIEHGQTISQPYIVALMTQLLAPDKQHKILEVGNGSVYQSAILAEMAASVYSVEIIASLADRAAKLLTELGYRNIYQKQGDGNEGGREHAPFDGIIVTAAAEHVPHMLLDQLKAGARMVIPVARTSHLQELRLITKNSDGTSRSAVILPVSFVPLTGGGK